MTIIRGAGLLFLLLFFFSLLSGCGNPEAARKPETESMKQIQDAMALLSSAHEQLGLINVSSIDCCTNRDRINASRSDVREAIGILDGINTSDPDEQSLVDLEKSVAAFYLELDDGVEGIFDAGEHIRMANSGISESDFNQARIESRLAEDLLEAAYLNFFQARNIAQGIDRGKVPEEQRNYLTGMMDDVPRLMAKVQETTRLASFYEPFTNGLEDLNEGLVLIRGRDWNRAEMKVNQSINELIRVKAILLDLEDSEFPEVVDNATQMRSTMETLITALSFYRGGLRDLRDGRTSSGQDQIRTAQKLLLESGLVSGQTVEVTPAMTSTPDKWGQTWDFYYSTSTPVSETKTGPVNGTIFIKTDPPGASIYACDWPHCSDHGGKIPGGCYLPSNATYLGTTKEDTYFSLDVTFNTTYRRDLIICKHLLERWKTTVELYPNKPISYLNVTLQPIRAA